MSQAAGVHRKRGLTRKVREALGAYSLIAPFLVLLLVFNLYVIIYGLRISLTDAANIGTGSYVGLKNFKDLLWADKYMQKDFWQSVRFTFKFVAGCLLTQIPAAFVLAYILNHIPLVKIRGLLRAAFFLPVLMNTVVIAFLFQQLFNKDQGVVNAIFGALGLPNQTDWLMNSSWSLWLLIAVSFWQWTGYHMVYFLSQLQTIDPTLYEAAKMDGASRVRVLFRVTLPLMRPAVTFVMVTAGIGGLQVFDMIFILFPNAQYGPGGAARSLVCYVYDQGFAQQFQTGVASAIGWLTFIIIMIFSLIQLRVFGLGKHDEA